MEVLSFTWRSRYQTIALPGVANTETGHCFKTEQIFKYVSEKFSTEKGWEWLVVTDDDTILGVRKMMEHLWLYGGTREEEGAYVRGLYVGERFGIEVAHGEHDYGFDYVTGGGGMAFDRDAVTKLAASCTCLKADSPDDVVLGACARRLGVAALHSNHFHQLQPIFYHPKLVEATVMRGGPVSFHKFQPMDPREVYDKMFGNGDRFIKDYKEQMRRSEL